MSKKTEIILKAVAEVFDLDLSELVGRRRTSDVALARQVAMYLIRQETNLSLDAVGNLLGERRPATVSHGYQVVAKALESNANISGKVVQCFVKYHEKEKEPVTLRSLGL